MLRTSVIRPVAVGILLTTMFMGSLPGHGTEQAGEKPAKRKYQWKSITPTANFADPKQELVDALRMLEDCAEELHSYGRRFCETLRNHHDPAVRIQAARTLGMIGFHPTFSSGLHALSDQLQIERNDEVKVEVLKGMHQCRPHNKDQIPRFIELMKHDNPKIRRAALLNIIGLLPEHKPQLLPVMIAAFDDPDVGDNPANKYFSSVSLLAILNLRDLKIPVKEAVPKLIQFAKENKGPDSYQMRVETLLAFSSPDDPFVRERAHSLLKQHQDRYGLRRGVRICGELSAAGKDIREFVPDFIPILGLKLARGVPDEETGHAVLTFLTRIGPDARDALPALRAFLERTEDSEYRERALQTIRAVEGKK